VSQFEIVPIKSTDEFKQLVKVGDYLRGWATGKIVKVTAIGLGRFLFLVNGYRKREGVATMICQANWQLLRGYQEPQEKEDLP
jgi:hypothetical protein